MAGIIVVMGPGQLDFNSLDEIADAIERATANPPPHPLGDYMALVAAEFVQSLRDGRDDDRLKALFGFIPRMAMRSRN